MAAAPGWLFRRFALVASTNPRGLDCLASGNNRKVKVMPSSIDEEIVLTLGFPPRHAFFSMEPFDIQTRGEDVWK